MSISFEQKVVILSGPSGTGKTTLMKHLLNSSLGKILGFSISATTRKPRPNEREGIDYFFLSLKDFENKIHEDAFLEWEEVYPGIRYGTLWTQIENLRKTQKHILFDIDVKGSLRLKNRFKNTCRSYFISLSNPKKVLIQRLETRNIHSPKSLKERINRVEWELSKKDSFDEIIVNDDLGTTQKRLIESVARFLGLNPSP
ncbi:MAG: guanylate kinase [Cytophagales bacterium]|nr:guanylate kinase [Cytophagales bacterium]